MENLESLEPLLRKISDLTQEEKLLKCEKEKRGETFNAFEILHIQNYEVKTHSAIIAELLNPKGTHGCKSAFLSLFIKMLLKSHKGLFNFSESDWQHLSDWNVFVEYNIGKISDDKENGGRLDILIASKEDDKAIIIENKIYASDQEKQLYRYQSFAKKYGKGNCAIIYLTLDGHEPNIISIKYGDCVMKEDEDFCRMSYQSFMLDWLNACKEKATSKPLVRETISQYINTIAKLTHKNMDDKTKKDLIKLLVEDKINISAVFKINSVYKDVLNEVCNTVLIQQIKDIAGDLKFEYDCKPNKDWFNRYSQFLFSKQEWKHFCIGFEFMGNNLTDFSYGIKFKDKTDKSAFQDQKNQINKLLEEQLCRGQQGEWWAWFKRLESFDSWENEKAFEALYNGTIKEEIKKSINEILGKIDESLL